MRAFVATLMASAFAVSLAATPAAAGPFHHHHGGGFWGGPGLVFGLAAGAIAAGIAAEEYCTHYVEVYDDWGNYAGRRLVRGC